MGVICRLKIESGNGLCERQLRCRRFGSGGEHLFIVAGCLRVVPGASLRRAAQLGDGGALKWCQLANRTRLL